MRRLKQILLLSTGLFILWPSHVNVQPLSKDAKSNQAVSGRSLIVDDKEAAAWRVSDRISARISVLGGQTPGQIKLEYKTVGAAQDLPVQIRWCSCEDSVSLEMCQEELCPVGEVRASESARPNFRHSGWQLITSEPKYKIVGNHVAGLNAMAGDFTADLPYVDGPPGDGSVIRLWVRLVGPDNSGLTWDESNWYASFQYHGDPNWAPGIAPSLWRRIN